MEINNLTSLIGKNELYSNGSATVREVERIDPAAPHLDLPSVIYHGAKETPIVLYQGATDITIREGVTESSEDRRARMFEIGRMPGELADNSVSLQAAFGEVTDALSTALVSKDWGFSVTNGELVILEGDDALSDPERKVIEETLSEFGIERLSNALASDFVAGVEAIRGPYETGRGIAKYDISEANFGEIVDLRDYLYANSEEGTYGHRLEYLTDKNDMESAFWLSGLDAMFDQISVHAEPKYA